MSSGGVTRTKTDRLQHLVDAYARSTNHANARELAEPIDRMAERTYVETRSGSPNLVNGLCSSFADPSKYESIFERLKAFARACPPPLDIEIGRVLSPVLRELCDDCRARGAPQRADSLAKAHAADAKDLRNHHHLHHHRRVTVSRKAFGLLTEYLTRNNDVTMTNIIRRIIRFDFNDSEEGGNSPAAEPKIKKEEEEENPELNRLKAAISRVKETPPLIAPSICLYNFNSAARLGLSSIAISTSTRMISATFDDSSVRLWNRLAPSTPTTLLGHTGPVYSSCFTHDERHLLTASADKTVRLWDVPARANTVLYAGHAWPVVDVALSPVGFYFATASLDTTARLWQTDATHPVRVFAGHTAAVNAVRFHPNGNYVVTGSTDRTARLWSLQSGEFVRVFAGKHRRAVRCVAVAPHGRLLVSGDDDGDVVVWDIASASIFKEFKTDLTVHCVEFSPDGRAVASAGDDGVVRVWDVQDDAGPPRHGVYRSPKPSSIYCLRYRNPSLLLAAGLHPANK
ncbi:TAF5-like RNA polymerase II p300/CBP-associated factor-associated factor 65 kDa subunit 5L [Oscarella lobularis]|uniref:TAF5-like RNA polymerase II p300/CBP-associated factor-associated factor 65 kDa subunit 5L n=1 Tax=Oscarella lobularis TaxID=121494 RepID=UPI003313E5F2